MRRLISILLCVLFCVGAASAESIDLANMTYDELVELKGCLNIAIWQSKDWSEVTVPMGVWQVGVDIPAGKYAVNPVGDFGKIEVYQDDGQGGTSLDTVYDFMMGKMDSDVKKPVDVIEISDGMFVRISVMSDIVFIPYQVDAAKQYNPLSGMAYDSLMALKDDLNNALWEKGKWLDIPVYKGTIQSGKDIPAGWYRVSTDKKSSSADLQTGYILDADGRIDIGSSFAVQKPLIEKYMAFYLGDWWHVDSAVIYFPEGMYANVDNGSVLFSTHAGKAEFSFVRNAR